MRICEAIETLLYNRSYGNVDIAKTVAINTMRKYQKIEDIYYHQSGKALENSLRAVIEDEHDN